MPPSTLSKNRLFIERDNKNRRITSNFGTTFKNSKWTPYSNSNTKTFFKTLFRRLFWCSIYFGIFVLFLYFFQDHYLCSSLYNKIYLYFWSGVDSLDYHLSYCFWATAGFISFAWNSAYSYFFFNNLSAAPNSKSGETVFEQFKRLNPPKKIAKKIESPKLDKADADWALFSFTDDAVKCVNKILDSKIMENLFEQTLNAIKWIESFSVYIDLFKATYFATWLVASKNALFSNYYFQKLWNHNWFPNPYEAHYAACRQTCAYISQFTPQRRREIYDKILNSRVGDFINFFYDFKKTEKQNLKTNFLIKNKTGSFNFWDLKHDQLTNLLNNLTSINTLQHSLSEQIKIMKIDRWLYRYSTLSRKILKNSHKITMSKKILNYNEYSKNDFKKNLWTSANEANLFKSNPTLFSNVSNFFYGESSLPNSLLSILKNDVLLNTLAASSINMNNLKSHENSYFWFLKRMYNFNGLSSHEISLQKKFKKISLPTFRDDLFNEKLLKDNFFFKNIQTFVNNNEINFFNETRAVTFTKINKNATDLYLNYSDFNLYDKEINTLFFNLFSQFNRNAINSTSFLYLNFVKNCAFINYTILNKRYRSINVGPYTINIIIKKNAIFDCVREAKNFFFKSK